MRELSISIKKNLPQEVPTTVVRFKINNTSVLNTLPPTETYHLESMNTEAKQGKFIPFERQIKLCCCWIVVEKLKIKIHMYSFN